ncbi:MAG: dihydroorotase [Actinomycetales bacterium]|nr:dihydroorotase [Actinomycetales bacterium]
MNYQLVLKNTNLGDGTTVDIAIEQETIVAIDTGLSGEVEIECRGLIALPGFVDLHTHLREPGFEASETVLTGSRAAAKGGYTAIHPMANTNPVADTAGVVEQVKALGDAAGYVDVFPIGAVTVDLGGVQLAELGAMADSKAKVRVFSDDGKCVSDPLMMRRALEYVKKFDGVIAQHAQDPRLTEGAQMNEGQVSAQLGLTGWPGVAEESIIARDVMLAETLDSRIHICHLSTARSVEIVRWAKQRGIRVTAEVTPHHLLLTDELARTYDPVYKVNPPLRTEADVLALREALIDGTIDIIATDHAPHPAEAKECEWDAAAFGMVGLETAVSVAQLVLIDSGRSNWQRLAEVMSLNPAKIAADLGQGEAIKVGSTANLALVDPAVQREIVAVTESKSRNNPFAGMTLPGRVVHTIYRGRPTVLDGSIVEVAR